MPPLPGMEGAHYEYGEGDPTALHDLQMQAAAEEFTQVFVNITMGDGNTSRVELFLPPKQDANYAANLAVTAINGAVSYKVEEAIIARPGYVPGDCGEPINY